MFHCAVRFSPPVISFSVHLRWWHVANQNKNTPASFRTVSPFSGICLSPIIATMLSCSAHLRFSTIRASPSTTVVVVLQGHRLASTRLLSCFFSLGCCRPSSPAPCFISVVVVLPLRFIFSTLVRGYRLVLSLYKFCFFSPASTKLLYFIKSNVV